MCRGVNTPSDQEKHLLGLICVIAGVTLHLHGVVTQLLVQVVGGASSRFACWQCHLDASRFGTFRLASGQSGGGRKNKKNAVSPADCSSNMNPRVFSKGSK